MLFSGPLGVTATHSIMAAYNFWASPNGWRAWTQTNPKVLDSIQAFFTRLSNEHQYTAKSFLFLFLQAFPRDAMFCSHKQTLQNMCLSGHFCCGCIAYLSRTKKPACLLLLLVTHTNTQTSKYCKGENCGDPNQFCSLEGIFLLKVWDSLWSIETELFLRNCTWEGRGGDH